MITLIWKTALMYIIVNIAVRCMGKRQVGELSPSEVIVAFLISEVASAPLGDPDIKFSHSLAAIFVLVVMEILYSYLSIKSPFFMALTQGRPTVIMEDGAILEKELLRNRLTIAELNEELRLKNINISDVHLAIIENNGQVSIIPKNEAAGVTRRDLGIKAPEAPQDFAVIIDGQVLKDNLKRAGQDLKFLDSELRKRKIKSPKEVLALYADTNGVTFFQKKVARNGKSVENGKKNRKK
ncbi:MAG: DUF421 domain-containing protein [Clostridia bacterium]|nr:DUF421 domain-containing protein [Clostridia bacterium]